MKRLGFILVILCVLSAILLGLLWLTRKTYDRECDAIMVRVEARNLEIAVLEKEMEVRQAERDLELQQLRGDPAQTWDAELRLKRAELDLFDAKLKLRTAKAYGTESTYK